MPDLYDYWRLFLCFIGFGSRVELLCSRKSARVGDRIDLIDLVKSSCPSLYGKDAFYMAPFYCASGHLATIFSAVANFSNVDQVLWQRQYLRTTDGGTLAIDFAPTFDQAPVDDRPILLMIHGLTGGSHESYVRHVTIPAVEKGWRVCVANYRGCGFPSILTSARFYHGGETTDPRRVIRHLRQTFPNAPIVAVGFSLGANIITKLAGEDGDTCPLNAVVALCNPWDFWTGAVALESSPLGRLYSRKMALSLRTVLARNLDIFKDDKRIKLDLVYSNPCQNLYSFDNQVTAQFAGHRNTEEYYLAESSAQFLPNVKVPLLAINSRDDVITAYNAVPLTHFANNPFTILATTKRGGHLGYFEGMDAYSTKRRWLAKPTLEFLGAVLDHDRRAKSVAPYSQADFETYVVAAELVETKEAVAQEGQTLQGL